MGYREEWDYSRVTEFWAREKAMWEDHCATVNGLKLLGANLEMAATLTAFGAARYAKGFADAKVLESFTDGDLFSPYFPMADNRPTAERLGWTGS